MTQFTFKLNEITISNNTGETIQFETCQTIDEIFDLVMENEAAVGDKKVLQELTSLYEEVDDPYAAELRRPRILSEKASDLQ